MKKRTGGYKVLGETSWERIHLENLGVVRRITLKFIFKKRDRGKYVIDRTQDADV